MKYTWEYSENEEIWQNDVFDTIEDCILDAKENYCVEPDGTIAIGEIVPWEPHVSAYNILEQIEEDAYEECGEIADGWKTFEWKNDRKKVEELSEKLTEIVKQWLKDNGTYPTFSKIENVKIVTVQ